MKTLLAQIDVKEGSDAIFNNSNPLKNNADVTGLPTQIIGNVINVVIYLVGFAAIGAIIYGGILYITSAGDAEKAARGRRSLTYGIIAVVLVIVSFILYNTVINKVSS